jgi:hypothetical protein
MRPWNRAIATRHPLPELRVHLARSYWPVSTDWPGQRIATPCNTYVTDPAGDGKARAIHRTDEKPRAHARGFRNYSLPSLAKPTTGSTPPKRFPEQVHGNLIQRGSGYSALFLKTI